MWRVSRHRCEEAAYVLAVANGELKEVYEVDRWDPAGTASYRYQTREEVNRPGRREFVGHQALGSTTLRWRVGQPVRCTG